MKDGPGPRALQYLREHHVATLATSGSSGPWAAAVFYVSEGFDLYFLSSPGSRHCENIARESRVAVTVQEDYSDWPNIKGLQLEGVAGVLSGDDESRARRLYGDKYPVVGRGAQAPTAIVNAIARIRWYRFTPRRAYFIDNSIGFGHRDELEISPLHLKRGNL
jgi:uncharacterized protein YhbP (UPF0306 family)